MKYKLVALDVDGTLINKNKEITPRTKEAIREVRRLGVEVTLCTGRMLAATKPFAHELELSLPLITYNGGLVVHYNNGQAIYERTLARESALEIIKGAREKGFAIHYYHDDRLLVEEITKGSKMYAEYSGVPLEKIDDLLSLPFNPLKLLLIGETESLNDFQVQCKGKLGDEIYITRSWPIFLEFLDPQANKGRGLKELSGYLGIQKDQIVSIGDNYNDLAMFDYAGVKVAMGNAEDVLKEAADFVTGTNEEGGVAQVLEKIIEGKL